MCVNGVPQINQLCTQTDLSTAPAGVSVDEICYHQSSMYEPEYVAIIDRAICAHESTLQQSICVAYEPVKAEICALWDQLDYVTDYVNMSKDELCGYTEEDGSVSDDMGTVCTDWPDVCSSYGVVDLEAMCHNLDSQPESLIDMELEWFCCDVSEWCIAEPQVSYNELVYPELCTDLVDIGP